MQVMVLRSGRSVPSARPGARRAGARLLGGMLLGSLAATAAPLAAEPAGDARFWASAVLVHRNLEETTAGGGRLLTESGPMLDLRLGARHAFGQGAMLAVELAAAGGALDYDGQTQAGVPLQTTSHHRDAGARLRWRPVAPQAWGEPWLVVAWHHNRRDISGTRSASGLIETSSAMLAGVRWHSPVQQATPRWQVRWEAEALVSLRHRLDVDFQGLYDPARLEGGRQRRTTVRLVGVAAGSPWEAALEWSHLNQAVSPVSALRQAGAAVGSVRQPRLTTDDVGVRLTRRF